MAKPGYKSKRRSLSQAEGPGRSSQKRSSEKSQKTQQKPSKPRGEKFQNASKPDPLPQRRKRDGVRLREQTGRVLETFPDNDYALIDSGNGRKLERYGPYLIDRPEAQAIWLPTLNKNEWQKVDAIFTGDLEEEGAGRWHYPKASLEETWPMAFDDMPYWGRFTSFRHVGVFPEQAAHWRAMEKVIVEARETMSRPVRVLNLFGYTGLASLIAARAGAEVTHVDASKKAIGWARENQQLAGLDDKPIRWICDDAMKFCAREVRRNKSYDLILLDPPAYGRGPAGEVWQLFDHLPHLLDHVRDLQSETPLMSVLTSYAIRASSFAIHEIMQEVFAGMDGEIQSGELILKQENGGRLLSTSMFSRFIATGCRP